MKNLSIAQINVEAGYGSTGKIAQMIGTYARQEGMESYIFYGRKKNSGSENTFGIGTKLEQGLHLIETRLFDRHGKGSKKATKELLIRLDDLKVDLLHLHNIHGYYLNYDILFHYIKQRNLPVVWTLHDCWTFTGHCTHFEYVGCEKWKTQCHTCELKTDFPSSILKDRSVKNYQEKKEAFTNVQKMTLVPVSKWLDNKLEDSFLQQYESVVIGNGIDLNSFKRTIDLPFPKYLDKRKKTILGVASVWSPTKGIEDFFKLSALLNKNEQLVLVGLTKNQIKKMPKNIIGLERTQNKKELIQLYSVADAFLNLTYADTYPTTNIEAMACGTPVIAYRTGGCTEMINEHNGRLIKVGDYEASLREFRNICENPLDKDKIIAFAKKNFDSTKQLKKYLEIYRDMLSK